MGIDDLHAMGVDNPWGFLTLLLVAVFGTPAILSEKAAQKFGALGALARWWGRRKDKALAEDQALRQRERDALWAEIARVDGKVNELEAELEELRAEDAKKHGYIVWVTQLMRGLEIWAAKRGLELPPPPFKTYSEWQQARESE